MTSDASSDNKATLGLPTLTALVIANMIGVGVFTSSGFSLAALGNPDRVMLAWAVCGIWAICGAVAYGALAARLPLSGGEYLYLSRLVHPAVGFLAGWISVIAGFTAPIAAAAYGAAVYAMPNAEANDTRITLLAAGIILAAAICHLIGIFFGTAAQNIIVATKLILLALLVGWAMLLSDSSNWSGGPLDGRSTSLWPENFNDWRDLVGSMSWIALSYTGFNAAIYVAGEARDARSVVPRAMIIGTVIVTALYLMLNYVFVYAPAADLIVGQERVASIAANAVGGKSLETVVRVIIVLSMTSSVFAMLLAGPRVYQKMAEDSVMPQVFDSAGKSPKVAVIAQTALSLIAVFTADLLQLMKYLGLTLSACGALAILSLCWVRSKQPDSQPLNPVQIFCVGTYLLITVLILAASWETHRIEFLAMLGTFAVGAVIYAIWYSVQRMRA